MEQVIRTERLILRKWCEEDFELFAEMNADERVRRYFPSVQTRSESDASARLIQEKMEEHGCGFWAVSLLDLDGSNDFNRGPEAAAAANFIGFIGLAKVLFDAHFTPAVEIGWRLAYSYWGKGYATEGALACLAYGFETLGLAEIVSFTATQNKPSQRVMERIGMIHDPVDDFDHPNLEISHALSRHVLYRKRNAEILLS